MRLFLSLLILCAFCGRLRTSCTVTVLPPQKETYLLIVESRAEADPEPLPAAEPERPRVRIDPQQTVRFHTDNGVQELPLDEYLTCVMLSELLPCFDTETFKAQAVAARTVTMRNSVSGRHEDGGVCGDPGCCQAYHSPAELAQMLGSSFVSAWDKARAAVLDTDGEILLYGGELIEALYFSCSGGASEPASAVWGCDLPYLRSVNSPGEENALKFVSGKTVSVSEFRQTLLTVRPDCDLSGTPESWFGSCERSDGGGVLTAQIGGAKFSGTGLRALFGLASTNFTVSADGESIHFAVRGSGHRVGMSQYGAEAMAQGGSTYREILSHYYTGVEFGTLDP